MSAAEQPAAQQLRAMLVKTGWDDPAMALQVALTQKIIVERLAAPENRGLLAEFAIEAGAFELVFGENELPEFSGSLYRTLL